MRFSSSRRDVISGCSCERKENSTSLSPPAVAQWPISPPSFPPTSEATMPPLSSHSRRKRQRTPPLFWVSLALLTVAPVDAQTTFQIFSLPEPSLGPSLEPGSVSPSQVPTSETTQEVSPYDNPQQEQEGPTNNAASSPPPRTIFGTQAGYDQPAGHQAMCWKTTFDLPQMELLPTCGDQQVLGILLPQEEERLRIHQSYEYQVQLELDLTAFGVPDEMEILSPQAPPSLALQILFCRVGQVSFCSPFVPEQLLALEDDSTSPSLQQPYFDSDWIHLPVPDNTTHINETISIPTVVDQVGSYFVLATLRFVTADRNHSQQEVPPQPRYRWDMANGLKPAGGRVVQYWEPIEIMEVSQGARITSYVAVALASCILLALLGQTIIHRKNQVLHLSQVGFMILFLVAALLATTSTVLREPKNDLYCRLVSPMTLIPLHLMYSITIGRLWRINAVISPLLVEHFRKNLGKERWTGKLVSWVQRQTAGCSRQRNVQLRRTVTKGKLAFVISMFAIPQVILQVCALILQPQQRVLQFDGDTGMAVCEPTNVNHPLGNILHYAHAALLFLLVMLLIMAYSCRKLPSLFNETTVIYHFIFRTFRFIVFGAVLVIVLQTQQHSIAPDITYLWWVTVILYTTLASSLGLLLPKLRMIWKGEIVIVSKLVSDHHRARRAKARGKRDGKGGMENVTGIDLSQSYTSDSYLNGSFNTEAYANGSTLGASFTNSDPHSDRVPVEPKRPKLSEARERSGASSCSIPVTCSANSESSNSFLPITSEEVDNKDDDPFDVEDGDHPFEEEKDGSKRSLLMGQWQARMRTKLRDKWQSGPSFRLTDSRHNSEFLPTASTAADDLHNDNDDDDPEDNNSNNNGTAAEETPDHTRDRSSMPNRLRHEKRMKRQRSRRRRAMSLMTVRPDETPPRRLVMKLMDQQDCLTGITTKIMSGLAVTPAQWDQLVRLHTILEKCFQEEVEFSWKEKPLVARSQRQLLDRDSSSRSLGADDLTISIEDNKPNNKTSCQDNDIDHRSVGGNSNDATLLRSNTQPSAPFRKLSRVAKEFRRVVDCRDRKYGLSTYKTCFIGSDAIDSLIYAGVVESREAGVTLGRRLVEELHLFKHVTGDHQFEDKQLFYEYYSDLDSDDCSSSQDDEVNNESIQLFDINEKDVQLETQARAFRDAIDVRDRRYHLKLYPKVFVGCEAVDALIYQGVAKTRWEAVQLGRRLAREMKLFRHVCGDHELRDEWLFYRFSELDEHGVESSLGSALSDSVRPKSEIAELAEAFEMYVDIRNRWYHAKKYKSCFIGSEAIDAMIYAGLATTREEGVTLGRRLEKELRLFHHACHDHQFKDDYLFYQLRRHRPNLEGSSTGRSLDDRSADLDESGSSNHDQLAASMGSSSQSDKQTRFINLMDKAGAFRQCAVITTGTWRMKKYPNVFIGCDTVDRMVYSGLAKDRMEAVQLGRALARKLKLFRHVANNHAFCDSFLFYRFKSEDDMNSSGSVSTFSKNSNIVSPPRNVHAGGELSESQSQSNNNNNSYSSSLTVRGALGEKADLFKSFAKVKDRKYRLTSYKSCFVGEQVVDSLVEAGIVDTREAAVEYGRELESQLRLFKHVNGGHSFKDEYLFYRFRDLGFKEGLDVLGTSLNSADEMSISSTIGGDYSRSDVGDDGMDAPGGPARSFGLPVLDENSELGAADSLHTRIRENEIDLGDSANLPPLMEYADIDTENVAEVIKDANMRSMLPKLDEEASGDPVRNTTNEKDPEDMV